MGKLVTVNAPYSQVALPPFNLPFNAGQQTTLTDAEYAALPAATTRALTVSGNPADPSRNTSTPPVSLADAVAQSKAYTDAAVGTATGAQGAPGLVWRQAYNNSTTYGIGDAVFGPDGNSYICIAATTGVAPPNTTYWSLLALGNTSASMESLAVGEIMPPRRIVLNAAPLVSGTVIFTYGMANKSEAITKFATFGPTVAAAGATFAGFAVYSVDPITGNLTRLALTNNVANLWTTQYPTLGGTNTTGTLTTTWNKVAGQTYALAVLFVGTTAPTLPAGIGSSGDGVANKILPAASASLTGQSGFPSTVAWSALATGPWQPGIMVTPS